LITWRRSPLLKLAGIANAKLTSLTTAVAAGLPLEDWPEAIVTIKGVIMPIR